MHYAYKFVLGLMLIKWVSSETASRPPVSPEEPLKRINAILFATQPVQLELLQDFPQTIPVIAQWLYDDWHSYDIFLTKEHLIQSLQEHLDDPSSITLVALKDCVPIGAISLHRDTEPELADLKNDSVIWGGTFHVIPEERHQGLGESLAKAAATLAKQMGYKKILFYTSDPKNVPWYTPRGAEVLETRPFRNHVITIFQFRL